jgi:hypothetical protein
VAVRVGQVYAALRVHTRLRARFRVHIREGIERCVRTVSC